MDVIWGYLSSLKLGNGTHKSGRINDVAKTVLILPHSNAGEERVVSLIRKTGGRYVGLFVYYQNGQHRVIF